VVSIPARIPEVSDQILGTETGYPVSSFSWFSSVPPGECGTVTLKLGHDRFLPFFTIHHHSLIILSSELYSIVTEKRVVK
jgi:uncharacterized membrane protein